MYFRITTARSVFAYNDAAKALRKIRTLQRNNVPFTITDATDMPIALAEVERAAANA